MRIPDPPLELEDTALYPGLAPFVRTRLLRRDRRRAAAEAERRWFDLRPPSINRVQWRAMSDKRRAEALAALTATPAAAADAVSPPSGA